MAETLIIDVESGPDDRERFHCIANGYSSYLTLDQIKAAIARGATVKEWVKK